ncbi:MAG: nitrilase-related carbon-nitrogen hydrolase [Dermatophilaceae bacterium]|jgi:predicted amidohydrolase
MRVALIQLGYPDDESVADRVARAAAMVVAARGHDLVVLPELWAPTGFDYHTWVERAEPVDGQVASAMAAAAAEAGVVLHAGSIIERLPHAGVEGKQLANTSLIFGRDGELVTAYRKIHRFGFAEGEPALLEAGDEVVVTALPLAEDALVMAGISTCYDLRFPELYRQQVDSGATLFVVPAAWPLARVAHWSLLSRARAVENQCFVLACNTAGTHAGVRMGGHSVVVGPTGTVLAEAGTDETVLSVELDIGEVRAARAAFPVLADRRL